MTQNNTKFLEIQKTLKTSCSKNRNGSRKVDDMNIEMEPEQLPCDWVWPVELGINPCQRYRIFSSTLHQDYSLTEI